MIKVREIVKRLKRLWAISKTYDAQMGNLERNINLAHKRIGDYTTVHGDLHLRSPSHIIAIGRYRNHDYVRIFDLDTRSFGEIVEVLKNIEPYSRVGRFDTLMGVPFKAFFPRDIFA